ncbi:HGGxSTG domain-containing protein [Neisseria weixii]|uniref:HGGxSTG domain-containing protein n=1 Tax=Neisseria weixii TaxID=1853276 RepID=UPI001F19E2DB|nr:HGGxSTG domain-containing protein [Neisseria weixii]
MPLKGLKKNCGAKTRSGGECWNPAMPNGRCRLHGGKSTGAPKGHTNSRKPGSLYSVFYTDEEQALADEIELESVDEELRLCKIRLRRAMALEAEQKRRQEEESEKARLELDKIVETPSVVGGIAIESDPDVPPVRQKTFVYRDYGEIINRLLARIESLTLTRQRLLKGLIVDLKSTDGSMTPKEPVQMSKEEFSDALADALGKITK